MKLLLVGKKLKLNGRKLALAIAACYTRCCAPSLWNRATLCNPSEVPPEIPRDITFPDGFICGDGCPLSGSRIIIYRGWCYNVESGPGNVECQGTRPKPKTYIAPYFGATVVTWAELSCKPLTAECSDNSCVPVEPGCCTRPYTFRACDTNNPVVCNLPKKFRVRRQASWRWRSWVYTDPGTCSGRYICQETMLTIDGYADFACDENNIDANGQSQSLCFNVQGSATLSGWIDNTGVGVDANGTYPFDIPIGSAFGGFGPAFPSDASDWGIPNAIRSLLPIPFANFPFCGGSHSFVSDPPNCYTRTVTCPGGIRSVLTETANCANGTFDNIVYRDCVLWDQTYQSVGNYLPPCPADEAWNDVGVDRITLSSLAGCENAPAWNGGQVGTGRPYPYPLPVQTTGEMLEAMGE